MQELVVEEREVGRLQRPPRRLFHLSDAEVPLDPHRVRDLLVVR
jgi:hypothetical protein